MNSFKGNKKVVATLVQVAVYSMYKTLFEEVKAH